VHDPVNDTESKGAVSKGQRPRHERSAL
jgi:hypothetical protein